MSTKAVAAFQWRQCRRFVTYAPAPRFSACHELEPVTSATPSIRPEVWTPAR